MELKTFFRKGENLFGVGSLLILAAYVPPSSAKTCLITSSLSTLRISPEWFTGCIRVQCFGSSSATSSLPRF